MKTDLVVKDIQNALVEVKPEYKTMLKNIDKNMPMIQQASSNFYKSHSQFMGVTLDVTAITPIRSIKHTLAEVDKTKSALQEAQINMQKKAVELKMKQRELLECQDDLEREMLEVEILELQTHVNDMAEVVRIITIISKLVKSLKIIELAFGPQFSSP